MKIAQVSPLWERVPPPAYGGIELVVSHLTDELVRRGHEVVLFASGDSETLAKLESVYPRALRNDANIKEYSVYEMLELSRVYERAAEFDIIHSHVGIAALPFGSLVKTPTMHTLHGNFTSDNRKIFSHHAKQAFISISNNQRDGVGLNYIRTVYNGIDLEGYPFFPQASEPPYLAFLGRLSPEKGPHQAIAIAKQTGWRLKMAGKIDRVDRQFFETEIAPQLDGKQIEYLGEISHSEKIELLGNAAVTLFPITWREPFGLVMIESMATGTPAIGINLGSVPEVIAHGKTGFVCQSIDEIAALIPAASELSRQTCREHVANHFSVSQMVDGYEAAYRQVIESRIAWNGRIHTPASISSF
ncbi:MAG TPA: glycosyl transferase [Cyanobacteria bacterium UBA11372]|nr:glycosyl transferase [Cyanobacteria bacterium UBA11372]